MTYRQLINASKIQLRHDGNHDMPPTQIQHMFPDGARWMHDRLNELQPLTTHDFDPKIGYTYYGLLKYCTCLIGCAIPLAAGYKHIYLATLAAIAIFYLLEIHFLFLFPLLIDRARRPIQSSIRATYKIGVCRCLFNVIPIAGYMLIGLFRKTNRLRNWYIGCLAILIWYQHDVRNRI